MKITHLLSIAAMSGFCLLTACDPNTEKKDTKETTEKENDAKIEATAPTDSASHANKDDADWIVETASGGMLEVEAGKLAGEKAISPEVKKFAQHLVDDHTAANNDLKKLAEAKNVTLPADLIDKDLKVLNDLKEKKAGADFDKKFISDMISDHKDDIDKFEKAADKANDPAIKDFAAKTLPTLIKHREMAEKIEKGLKHN